MLGDGSVIDPDTRTLGKTRQSRHATKGTVCAPSSPVYTLGPARPSCSKRRRPPHTLRKMCLRYSNHTGRKHKPRTTSECSSEASPAESVHASECRKV